MNTETHQKLAIIDDDQALRHSLQWLLESSGYQADLYASADAFLTRIEDHQPACILLDVRMPGMSGLELQQTLNLRASMIPIIIITGHGDIDMAVQAMKAGAVDFIEKPFDDDSLLNAIERALVYNQSVQEQQRLGANLQQRINRLTPREQEVLQMVTNGDANKKMALTLGVSTKTIEAHRAKVMDKMEATSLAELVKMTVLANN